MEGTFLDGVEYLEVFGVLDDQAPTTAKKEPQLLSILIRV